MSRSAAFDPLDKFRWRVFVLSPTGAEFARGGFSSCSSPGVTIAYESYEEGGSHMVPRKIHKGASFKPITLTRGVVANGGVDDFVKWFRDAFNVLNREPGAAQAPNYRLNLVIEHLDRDSSTVKQWILRNCVPVSYEPASDFDALDENTVSLESITLEYEGFEEIRPNGLINDVGDFFRRFSRGIF